MSIAYQIKPTEEKKQEINNFLNSYWGNDVWDTRDTFFDDLRPSKWSLSAKTIDFSAFNSLIKNEVKYMFAYRLQRKEIRLISITAYGVALNHLAEFLNTYYPRAASIANIPYDKAILQWRSYLIDKEMSINDNGKISSNQYETVFNQLYSFFVNLYDTRDEYEKDVWDCRKIAGAKITENLSAYYLNFTDIPLEFRELIKRYELYHL